ncbi:PAS domain S-box protein [Mucilaginibacter sp. BJC16-A38]|uniref:PAS domain-containing hybrid sensor histidine kinase/response regulator n=1 Tax=Mucilaginibacter phenanthrenivorans TaxID=1234842 RepID=UPI002157A5D6|nr:PAS domain S-box protein [Mucilaginibacter phenanthrenivorans]MCR8559872.1 PAS domain S-box protein [Mucilaginibacter phenanthrenivorans]
MPFTTTIYNSLKKQANMPLKSRLLPFIQNDNTVCQLLLTGLLITSPALHYLCFYKSFDPLWLRAINSAICLVALLLSFYTKRFFSTASRYLTIVSFLIINNGILLSLNGFEHVYLFSSVAIFIVLTLLCKKRWEFIALCALNLLITSTAYITSAAPHISVTILATMLTAFTFIAYVSFLVRMAYNHRFKKALGNVNELNKSLLTSGEKLRQSGKKLDALINSLNDIIFEFDENKICLNTWFSRVEGRVIDPELCIGKRLVDVLGPEKAKKFDDAMDYVIEHHKPVSITYPSDFGTGRWFVAKLVPVYDRNGNYTSRVSASVTDISEQKKYADALKENETLLLEAQSIAKIGNWYFDIITRETFLSESLLNILEIGSIPENVEKFEYYLGLVHPDDREEAYNYLTNIHKIDNKEFEHKLITPSGSLKYIKILKGEFLRAGDGSVKRIIGILQDITEVKLSEKKIKRSQAELVEAQLIAKIGNWKWDIALNKLTWSDEINNIFEVNPETITEGSIIKLLVKYAHPNDRHILKQHLKDISNITHTSYEYRIITPKGNIKYLSIIIGKLLRRDDGVVRKVIGTIQDITDRKQAEIDYLRTENKYKLVLETIKMPAISVDKKGTLIFCNKFMAHILGYDQNEILGLNWLEKFLPEDQRHGLARWFINGSFEAQYISSVICRNGEVRNINWQNTVSYDENGTIREVTSIGEDITLRQRATQALISAKEEAEKSSHFKSEFLSIMSHEIRTPMNAVIGTTNLLLSENPLPEQLEYLNILKFSGENLLAIINDILDYNKIEAGKLALNPLPFSVFNLAQKIKQSFYARAAEKDLEIDLIIDSSIPEYLIGDQVRLGQVLNNLLSNAVKFTHEGKVSIQLEKEAIRGEQVTVRFTVTDTGIGISAQSLASIFDPFMQESQTHENDYGGTGLGLAITKRLIELHQSNIEVISELDKGTQFSFSIAFHIAKQEDKNNNMLSPAANTNIGRSLQGMRVLVVDDNKMNLMIASKFLKKWHVEVDEAISGELAIEMAAATHYDLIIMDLQMPVMDGFETTRLIRKTNADTPVIALTADAMPETRNKALAAGMCNYLTKPFVPDTLYEKVSGYYNPVEKVVD